MRNLVQCAITAAVLVSGVASQATTLAVPKNPVTLTTQSTFRASVADLSDDTPAIIQWNLFSNTFTFQWDFGTNSFSEEWRTPKSLIYTKDVLGG